MARPRKRRCIRRKPKANYFKPSSIPESLLKEVNLTLDELEAIRLADLEGLYQKKAASMMMMISRSTFSRLIKSAHKKIAEAVVRGKGLRIEGGDYKITKARKI